MNIKKHILKLFKFYSADYLITGMAFMFSYLAILFIFSFSSIVGQKALDSFNRSFKGADFIFASKKGIQFNKSGSLILNNGIDEINEKKIINFLKTENIRYQTITYLNTSSVAYISVFQKDNISRLFKYCNDNNILVKSSFNSENQRTSHSVIMYNVNGYGNRFNIFSFQDQITSFILSNEFSSVIGQLSRLVFIFSVIFTFYLSFLYFKERQSIYRILLLQGYSDLALKLIFIEYLIVNFLAIILSVIPLALVLWLNGIKISFAFWGFIYSLPYLPIILLIQVLLLFNRALNYLKDE